MRSFLSKLDRLIGGIVALLMALALALGLLIGRERERRGKEAGLGNIALEVEEIQTLHLCLLVRRTAHRSRRQLIGTLYRAVDQGLVKIACDRAGHCIAITGARSFIRRQGQDFGR